MGTLRSKSIGFAVLAAGLVSGVSRAASWFPLGPFGGDARSLAADPADPKHLFLGTETGWIYDSHDGGTSWKRVAQVANRNDLAIDHIVVDKTNPKRLVVGAFVVDHPADGGLFVSEDYGKNWYSQAEMRGQSIRALTRSNSDPKELVAGTLKGIFRTLDNGIHWTQISPVGSSEIHEVQSIAIDPNDPNVIYAGTWHLPWKTTDGGVTWHNIKEGVIDDSDVFSIIVDPKDPKVVYASACSGIYKSSDAGEMFRKVQGIPSSARRTRALEQDPSNLATVFAGTTEGLYRTLDAGAQWERLTPADMIVNDVYVDPTNDQHVILATDRGGVYRSEDGGSTFKASNAGFSTRQVTAFAADPQHPGNLFVGVVNGKSTGGVFTSTDGAVHWEQNSEGLGGRDIFSLLSLEDGTLLAGTEHGIYKLNEGNWKDSSVLEGEPPTTEKAAAVKRLPPQSPVALMHTSAAVHSSGRAVPSHKTHTAIVSRGRSPSKKAVSRRVVPSKGPYRGTAPAAHLVHTSVRVDGKMLPRTGTRSRAAAVPHRNHMHAPASAHKAEAAPTSKAVRPAAKSGKIDAQIFSFGRSGSTLWAATGDGLLRSADGGEHWSPVTSLALVDPRFLAIQPMPGTVASAPMTATSSASSTPLGAPTEPGTPGAQASPAASGTDAPATVMLAGNLTMVMISADGGSTWNPLPLPSGLTQVGAVSIDGDKNLWVGGREGVWYSPDNGASWKTLRNLFLTEVDSIFYDPAGKRVLVTGANSSAAFSVAQGNEKVTYWDTGWKLRFVRPVGNHLVAATLFDGMVVQPEMVDSPLAAPATK